MPVNFTRKAYLEVWRGAEYISRHISLMECAESASKEPGTYSVTIGGPPTRGVMSADGLHHTVPGNIYYEIEVPQADVSVYNVSADEPGGSDVIVQLAGAAAGAESSSPSAQQSSNNISVDLVGAGAPARAGTSTHSGSSPVQNLGFPRVCWYNIGPISAWAVDDPLGENMREGMALGDAIVLNMNPAILTGSDQADGDMSRQSIVNDLKARNPDLLVFDYTTVQTTSNSNGPSSGGFQAYSNAGPPGAELYWATKDFGLLQNGTQSPDGTDLVYHPSTGIPISDWWARTANGTKQANFGGYNNANYGVNICPSFTQANPQGLKFPEWDYLNSTKPLRMDDHAISNGGSGYGPDGINIYFDVLRRAPKSSRVDYNGDGQGDDADTYFNPFDPTHRSAQDTLIGGGGVSAADWRLGWRGFVDLFRADYPDMILICNMASWFGDDDTEGPLNDPLYDVMPEYQLVTGTSYPNVTNVTPRETVLQGGLVENLSSGGSQPTSITGVNDAGVTTAGNGDGWQVGYNKHRYQVSICSEPTILMAQYFIQSTVEGPRTPNNRRSFSWEPDPATPFHLHRWMDGMALMAGGYCSPAATRIGSGAGTFITPMHFDYYGTVNTGTTGLSKHWMGQPTGPPVVIAGSGDHRLLWRPFEGGAYMVNTSKTNSVAFNVADIGGAGVYERINGVQDPAWDTGAPVNSGFSIPPKDGIAFKVI